MELDLSPTPLVIKYGGQSYNMTMPSNLQLAQYGEQVQGLEPKEASEHMKKMICSLGLPEHVYDALEPGKFKLLVETLLEKKLTT